MFKKYRKKPVVISAMQWNGNVYNLIDSQKQMFNTIKKTSDTISIRSDFKLEIHTLEGIMLANIGDWIIVGVNGELYPCKDDIFKKTYEEV